MNKIMVSIISILLIIICSMGLSAADESEIADPAKYGTIPNLLDFTQSGHYETDFGDKFTVEWWYLNGEATSCDGKNIAFFVVLAHQECPDRFIMDGISLSHLLTFCSIYYDNGTSTFKYDEIYVPQFNVDHFISFHTPYVYYVYPGGQRTLYGNAYTGYYLNYQFDEFNTELVFYPKGKKIVDQAVQPLKFITYGHPSGYLEGSIFINDTEYFVTNLQGYMDHMITSTNNNSWAADMHGWSWSDVTAGDLQTVIYAIRSQDDDYGNYSYKHMTLLNRLNGKVIAEYSGDEVDITVNETDWINVNGDVPGYVEKRPGKVVYSADNLKVTVEAQNTVKFESIVGGLSIFVDYMSYQPDNASIQYNDEIQYGSAFNEYLIGNRGINTIPASQQ